MANEMKLSSEQQTIARCKEGDRDAFRWIVEQYQRLVFSVAFKMMCREDAAKDIVQETFIRVWLNIGRYNSDKIFSTWIYTITVRLCLDALEKGSRQQPMPEDERILKGFTDDLSPDIVLENSELAAVIRTLSQGLSPRQREVFTLVCLENMDTQKVMEITGLSARKIKSNLYVARKTIKKQLYRLGYE